MNFLQKKVAIMLLGTILVSQGIGFSYAQEVVEGVGAAAAKAAVVAANAKGEGEGGGLKGMGNTAAAAAAANVPIFSQQLTAIGNALSEVAGNTEAGKTIEGDQTIKEGIIHTLKIISQLLAKRILDMVVDDVVRWIQNGKEPRFVTDWEKFQDDAINQGVGEVTQALGAGFLCSPFSFDVRFALENVTFAQKATCTLDQITGNIEGFYDNFSEGGWLAYSEAWSSPQNNYYGMVLLAQQEASKRSAAKVSAAVNEAISGQGFLSVRDSAKKLIMLPGSAAGGLLKDSLGTPIRILEEVVGGGDTIQAYVDAIATAAINRLMKEGLSSLGAVAVKSAPSSPKKPCDNTTGPDRTVCVVLQKIGSIPGELVLLRNMSEVVNNLSISTAKVPTVARELNECIESQQGTGINPGTDEEIIPLISPLNRILIYNALISTTSTPGTIENDIVIYKAYIDETILILQDLNRETQALQSSIAEQNLAAFDTLFKKFEIYEIQRAQNLGLKYNTREAAQFDQFGPSPESPKKELQDLDHFNALFPVASPLGEVTNPDDIFRRILEVQDIIATRIKEAESALKICKD